jgi:hypothetical protein
MAFDIQFMGRVNTSANEKALKVWTYNATATGADETAATIQASGYFNAFQQNLTSGKEFGPLAVGDVMHLHGNDASGMFIVTSITTNVTVATYAAIGTVGTAQIQDLAVTTAKIADANVTTAKLADDAVTSDKVSDLVMKHARVSMTAAEWNGMFAAPFELIPAQGADSLIVLRDFRINIDYGGTAFEDGGAIALQYDDTAESGGVLATATYASATFNGHTADTSFAMAPVLTALAHAGVLNEGIYISNATEAFDAGTESVIEIDVWYNVVEMFA